MTIYVNGSLAYDRFMSFKGRFSEQILPDQLHNINISFTMDSMQEYFGGTAGNIAYGLAILKEKPVLLGNLGKDGDRYLEYLNALNVDVSLVGILPEEFTAGAYITTDLDNNQITSFNAGAMKYPSNWQVELMHPNNSLVIIAPGNIHDMQMLPEALRQQNIPFIYDPGQSLPSWQGPDLAKAIEGAGILIFNDYELELSCNLMKTDKNRLLQQVGSMIITKGAEGSLVYSNGQTWKVGASKVDKVLNPTGAGDAYRAGLLKGLAEGLDLVEACAWGSALAGLKVSHQGTQGYHLPENGLDIKAIAISRG